MHNKYATFVLPVLAGLAIVGAGFSTWVFSATAADATAAANGSVTITDVSNTGPQVTVALGEYDGTASGITGNFTAVTDPAFNLTLDQGTENGTSDHLKGVSFVWSGDAATTFTDAKNLDFSWSISNADAIKYSNYTVTITYEWELTGAAASYVLPQAHTADLTAANASSVNNAKTATLTAVTSLDIATGLKDDTSAKSYYVHSNIDLYDWEWRTDMKPTDINEYNSLRSALGAAAGSDEVTVSDAIGIKLTVHSAFTLKTSGN